uniref:BED-type domain-containing protein n=1 Tax=Romanomermis culicivorax TaxID=13658 RepID=A0A915IDJ1_ROMCU
MKNKWAIGSADGARQQQCQWVNRVSNQNTSKFPLDWINPSTEPSWSDWLQPVDGDPYKVHCTVCRKTFSLSNMGRQTIKSHLCSAKHIQQAELLTKTPSIMACFSAERSAITSGTAPLTIDIPDSTLHTATSTAETNKPPANPFILNEGLS